MTQGEFQTRERPHKGGVLRQETGKRPTNTTNEEYVMTDYRLLINGRLVKAAGTLEVIDPAGVGTKSQEGGEHVYCGDFDCD